MFRFTLFLPSEKIVIERWKSMGEICSKSRPTIFERVLGKINTKINARVVGLVGIVIGLLFGFLNPGLAQAQSVNYGAYYGPTGTASAYASSSSSQTQQQVRGSQYAQNPTYYIQGNRPCWDAAAAYHHVDPWLLYAIAYVESRFNNKAIGKNTNGSVDLGLMQINSIWYPTLRKQGIPLSALNNACASTYIGAWILSKNIKTYGYTWRAIGAYNSATPSKAYAYAKKVYEAHRILVSTHNPAALTSLYGSNLHGSNLHRSAFVLPRLYRNQVATR